MRADKGMPRAKMAGTERGFVRGQLAALDGLAVPAEAPAALPTTARQETLKQQQEAKRTKKQNESRREADIRRKKEELLEEGHDECEAMKRAVLFIDQRNSGRRAPGVVQSQNGMVRTVKGPSISTIEGRRAAAAKRLAKLPEHDTVFLTPGYRKVAKAPLGAKAVTNVMDASILGVGDLAVARTATPGFMAKVLGRRLAEPGYFDAGQIESVRVQSTLVFKEHYRTLSLAIHITQRGRSRYPREAVILDEAFAAERSIWTQLKTWADYQRHKGKKGLLDTAESLAALHTMFDSLDQQRQRYEFWG